MDNIYALFLDSIGFRVLGRTVFHNYVVTNFQ